jgi:SAM-dependent methyltransferase
VSASESQRFWDQKARENALFFVDDRVDYESPDVQAFWRGGEEALGYMLDASGLTIGPEESVVDIGCGVGRMTRALAGRARHVFAVDVSSEMLARARENNPELDNVEWLHGDGRSLGVLGDASVDGCFSHVVFQHIPDPEITMSYVRDMGRVLRPGGWALFQVSTDPTVHQPKRSLRDNVKRLILRRDDRAWWGSAVDPARLRQVAADSGLDVEQILDEGNQYTTVLARRRPEPV